MTTLFILMNVAFFGYTGFIAFRYGIQPSVSESYYRLPRNLQWLFTLATWAYAIMAMMIGLELTGNGLVFLAGAGICFVGAAPAFHKLGMERTVHTVGALVGVAAMHLFIIIEGYWYITLSFAVLSGLAFMVKWFYGKFIWWVEVFAFLSIVATYIFMIC